MNSLGEAPEYFFPIRTLNENGVDNDAALNYGPIIKMSFFFSGY
jgi:hypothetical protein